MPFAAEAGTDLTALTQYGVLGVLAIVLIAFARLAYNREVARADRLEAELRAQNAAIQDKAIPALLAAADAMSEVTELLRDMQRERRLELVRSRQDGDHG
jgi:hypothetical protein